MNIGRLAGGLWLWACFTGCARSPEASAPAASSTTTAAKAEQRAATPESPVAAPAPAPGPQGLDVAKSKASQDEAEFSSLEAAERALNQAKADLNRLALAEPAPVIGGDSTADRAAEKKSNGKPGRAASAGGATPPARSNGVCEEACRAFSSLSRAASAVCRLDGSGGTHCSRAKHVLADAQQRVASCSCPAAGD